MATPAAVLSIMVKAQGIAATTSDLKDLDKAGDKAAGGMSRTQKAAAGMAAGGLALAAKALKDSAGAALESEKASTKMQTQLKSLGIDYGKHAKHIDTVIQKHSQLSGLDDEELQGSFTNLVRTTKDVNKALTLNGLAADIARAKGIGLEAASKLVQKAHMGQAGALRRVGIEADMVTTAQRKVKDQLDAYRESHKKLSPEMQRHFDQLKEQAKAEDLIASGTANVTKLQEAFAGQASAYGATTAGAADRAKVAFENVQEVLGAKLLPILAKVGTALADALIWLEKHEKVATALVAVFGTLVTVLGVYSVATKVAAAATGIWTAAQWLLNAALTANPIGLIVLGIAALVAGLILAYKKSETFRNIVNGAFKAIKVVAGAVIDFVKDHWMLMISLLAGPFGIVIVQVIKHFDKIKGAVTAVVGWIRALPERVRGKLLEFGSTIVSAIAGAFGGLGHAILNKIEDAWQWVKDHIKLPEIKLPFGLGSVGGDGLGRGSLPAFGGGLMGARPSMGPVAGAGARFGLRVSSGLRRGSITSSGNQSYHSTGEALDLAGPPASMLGFFRYMKNTAGGRLAELIHTPGGAGIKNGRAHTYGGRVAADHFDHVHVAIDSGLPGVGDGIGQIQNLWTKAGGSANMANMAAAIAMAESAGNPNASNTNTDGSIDRGLWQINSVHGALSTFDRMGNARAAVKISSNGRNWNPWTVFKSGAYKKFLRKGGGSSGGRRSGTVTGGPTGMTPAERSAFYAPPAMDPMAAAAWRRAGYTLDEFGPLLGTGSNRTGPAKGGFGPQKGIPADFTFPEVPPPPSLSDFANSAIARARLTAATEDDVAALESLVAIRKAEMDAALANADPRDDAEAIDAYLSVSDGLKQLKESIDAAAEIQRQRDALNQQIADNQLRILALANQGPQIIAAVVAAVSGGIGGQVGLGFQTPGYAGGVARY